MTTPSLQAAKILSFNLPDDGGSIGLLNAEARVEQRVRQIAVVGQQQHSVGGIIEAPHRHHARSFRKQIGYGTPSGGIAHRGDDAGRFMQQEIGEGLGRPDRHAVNRNRVAVGDDRSQFAYHPSVDAHTAVCDQLVGGTARRHPRLR